MLVFGGGLLDEDGEAFAMDLGVEYVGDSEFQFDYTVLRPNSGLEKEVVSTPFVNYDGGLRATLQPEAEALAMIRLPYFDRTYGQVNGHRETPYRLEDSECPAVVRKGNGVWFAHELDRLYYERGVRLHRQLVENVLTKVDTRPMLSVAKLPSARRVSLLHLPQVSGVTVTLDLPETVKKAYLIPGREVVKLTKTGTKVTAQIPTWRMHTGLVEEY